MMRKFSDLATIKNKSYTAFFAAHERNGRISTSGLKSDVTIVFIEPDFPNDAEIMAIRP